MPGSGIWRTARRQPHRRSSCAGRSGDNRPRHVARCAALWSADTSYSWAVCEVTTGELLAEVTLDPATGEIASRARAGQAGLPPQPQNPYGDLRRS